MIKVENLCVSFGEKDVIKDLTFEIEKGDFVVITGQSGCGKSTLLNCLTFLEKYNSGTISYNDQEYSNLSNRKKLKILKNEYGIIFQDFGLLDDLSVYKNMAFVNKNESRIQEALDKFNLDIQLKENVAHLSGGEKQRLALVRIYLKKVNVIFADEPTGNLDEKNSENVIDTLRQLHKQGKTVIIVTHEEKYKKYATKCIEL